MINDPSQNKKPLIFYMAVAVSVIMLLNAFVFPMYPWMKTENN